MADIARIVFLIRVPTEDQDEFLAAYQQVRYVVADGVPGHLLDQVCQSPTDPEQWLITSEWDCMASFEAWERNPDHRTLIAPMRRCMAEARSLRFDVRVQTRSGDATPARPHATSALPRHDTNSALPRHDTTRSSA